MFVCVRIYPGDDSEIKKVSLVSCNLGSEYPKKLLPILQKKNISKARVSTRLGKILIQPNGRKIVEQSTGGSSQKYRSGILKETYALDERGVVVLVDSFFCKMGSSFFGYSLPKLQETKLTFFISESSPVARFICRI
jgi:hypothetical protein